MPHLLGDGVEGFGRGVRGAREPPRRVGEPLRRELAQPRQRARAQRVEQVGCGEPEPTKGPAKGAHLAGAITGEGQAAFRQLTADNTRFAPLLVGELEGVASGAEVRTSRTASGTVPRPHLVTLTLAVTATVAVAAGASRPDLGRHDDQ